MRITLEPTTDGRWQLWVAWGPDPDADLGVWIRTVAQAELGRRIDELVVAEQLAGTASLRRRRGKQD